MYHADRRLTFPSRHNCVVTDPTLKAAMNERPSGIVDSVTATDIRRLTIAGAVALIVLVTYWTLWFAARSTVASASTRAYYDFENAFPAADAWLGVCILLALRAARARRPSALFWLLTGGGACAYPFALCVVYAPAPGM